MRNTGSAVASLLVASSAAIASPCMSPPEQQGIDSRALAGFFRELARRNEGLHSLVVVRNRCVVAEAYWPPYSRNQRHYLNSATKAVLSALVGIAVDDGKLRAEDLVSSYLAEEAARGDPRKQRITVEHLLTMSSGIVWPQTASENASDEMGRSPDWVRFILQRPMAAEPGTLTNYSNGDSHLLSAVLQRATGATALEFARKRLFGPLGIHDVAWGSDPQGRNIGSAALQMRPVDMAMFGSLYLAKGEWQKQQVVTRAWVERSLAPHVKMPARGGPVEYGYYFWLYPERELVEAWGGAGQRIGLLRDVGVVVSMTADIATDIPRSQFAAWMYESIRRAVASPGRIRPHPSGVADLRRSIARATTP